MTDAEKEAIKIIENFDGDPLDLIPLLDENGGKHLDLERDEGSK